MQSTVQTGSAEASAEVPTRVCRDVREPERGEAGTVGTRTNRHGSEARGGSATRRCNSARTPRHIGKTLPPALLSKLPFTCTGVHWRAYTTALRVNARLQWGSNDQAPRLLRGPRSGEASSQIRTLKRSTHRLVSRAEKGARQTSFVTTAPIEGIALNAD